MSGESGKKPTFDYGPLVTDFEHFFPWVCAQLNLNADVFVEKVILHAENRNSTVSYVQNSTLQTVDKEVQTKLKKFMHQSLMKLPPFNDGEKDHQDNIPSKIPSLYHGSKMEITKNTATIYVKAIHDKENHLCELEFVKCCTIESHKVFKTIQSFVIYLSYLNSIVVKEIINCTAIFEISKLLQMANITKLYLDSCDVKEGNYYVLIEELNNLKSLSLARCRISDAILEAIASKLAYPEAGSKTLSILNLSSNHVTDEGAKMLEQALRSNRKLYYLNLADNRMTDEGASSLFDAFLEFPLSHKEQTDFQIRHWTYINKKRELVKEFELQLTREEEDTPIKTKEVSPRRNTSKTKVIKKDKTKSKLLVNVTHQININEKAVAMAEKILSDYEEPFEDVYRKNDLLHYSGNHTLRILNLAYNSLTYLSLKKLLKVLEHQKQLNRDPKGLVNVRVEGNYLPNCCKELQLIDSILNANCPSPILRSKTRRRSSSGRSSLSGSSRQQYY